ncbi:spermidine synthase [Bacillus thuringiensis]|uniref:PABS domain-containing protein n=1 Tax=Bacillus thuringiensis serovar toumanoffi TaxID=180862 RepID=A0ABD5HQN0_BACTU|nr:hypothetical protein [Bacillus thuringiensis]EEM92339.1 hypothetical protein bthur0013_63160 [Bacillus thuringiensis IBL 200]MCR6783910.1 hypothetical protein [Bacillus thuringiensis]MCR6861816.1 hypothetical protein [Bacillus thuringiensis]MCR6868678.1 hypothetical protein [Bacillus thuringiensis]MDW9207243.1 PABS domain-containing protein [Bacillus thuringiensis serovar toumanoffi]
MNIIKNSLYSEDHLLLHTLESLVSNDRIFVGNQPDDFAIAGLLENSKKVLMLGLGFGGSLRAILAGNHEIHITAVDINLSTLNACYSINENYFPYLNSRVTYIHDDAFKYINNYKGDRYDAICIDLYSKEGYPLQIIEDEFWEGLKKILTDEGTILFNSWGLPQQLHPFEGNTIQRSIATLFLSHFTYTGYLPHRRNITFVGSKIFKPKLNKDIDYTGIKEVDRLILDYYPYRLDNIITLDTTILNKKEHESDYINTMKQFDTEMFKRWPRLVSKCNEVMLSLDLPKIDNLSTIVKNPHLAKALTKAFLKNREIESMTVPILVGASAFKNSNDLDWYLEWLTTNREELLTNHKEWFINTAFWQVLSIATNPFSEYGYWAKKIKEVINELNNSGIKIK